MFESSTLSNFYYIDLDLGFFFIISFHNVENQINKITAHLCNNLALIDLEILVPAFYFIYFYIVNFQFVKIYSTKTLLGASKARTFL